MPLVFEGGNGVKDDESMTLKGEEGEHDELMEGREVGRA